MAFRINTAQDVRRVLARVTNELYEKKLDTKIANAMTLALNSILTSIRTDEQQKQIEAIEAKLDELEHEKTV